MTGGRDLPVNALAQVILERPEVEGRFPERPSRRDLVSASSQVLETFRARWVSAQEAGLVAPGRVAANFSKNEILEDVVPYLGGALSSAVGAYWLFTQPHLSGVVFRRHFLQMEELYGK